MTKLEGGGKGSRLEVYQAPDAVIAALQVIISTNYQVTPFSQMD